MSAPSCHPANPNQPARADALARSAVEKGVVERPVRPWRRHRRERVRERERPLLGPAVMREKIARQPFEIGGGGRAEFSIAMKRPGASGADMKTPPAGVSTTAWLMLQVPAISDACPGRVTPAPSALATTSKRPATTGVPPPVPVRRRGLRGHPSDDLGRPVQLRQQPFGVREAVARRAARRRRRCRQPQQAGAAHVGDVAGDLAGQRMVTKILATGDAPRAPSPRAGAARTQASSVGVCAGQGLCRQMRVDRIGDAAVVPLLDQAGGARVERLDRRAAARRPRRAGRARCHGRRSRCRRCRPPFRPLLCSIRGSARRASVPELAEVALHMPGAGQCAAPCRAVPTPAPGLPGRTAPP